MKKNFWIVLNSAILSSIVTLTISYFAFTSELFDGRAKQFVVVSFLMAKIDDYSTSTLRDFAEQSCQMDARALSIAKLKLDSVLHDKSSFLAAIQEDTNQFSKAFISKITRFDLPSNSYVADLKNSADSIIDLRLANHTFLAAYTYWKGRRDSLGEVLGLSQLNDSILYNQYKKFRAPEFQPDRSLMSPPRQNAQDYAQENKDFAQELKENTQANEQYQKQYQREQPFFDAGDTLIALISKYKQTVLKQKEDNDE